MKSQLLLKITTQITLHLVHNNSGIKKTAQESTDINAFIKYWNSNAIFNLVLQSVTPELEKGMNKRNNNIQYSLWEIIN
jgi:hypothetical protein